MLAQLNESEISMFWEHKDWLEIKKPPKGPNGGPLIVKMGMYLESLGNFQEAKMVCYLEIFYINLHFSHLKSIYTYI